MHKANRCSACGAPLHGSVCEYCGCENLPQEERPAATSGLTKEQEAMFCATMLRSLDDDWDKLADHKRDMKIAAFVMYATVVPFVFVAIKFVFAVCGIFG